MSPVVAQIEHVYELLSGLQTSELDDAGVLNWLIIVRLRIWQPDASAIDKLEFVKM